MAVHKGNKNNSVEEVTILECRACLQITTTESILYNIFDSWSTPWDGMQNTIAEDLARLADIKIHQTDKHSKVICKTCCQLLKNACSFTTIVRQSDHILQQRYPLEPQELDKIWPKPIQVDKSMNSSMHDNSMIVEIKQEVLSDSEHESTNGLYENGEDFPNLDIKIEPEEMIQQQPVHQYLLPVNGSLESDPLITEALTNGNCEEHLITRFKDEPVSEEEDQIQTDLPLECLLCAKEFNSVTGLKAHVIAQHSYKTVKRKINNSISPERKKCNYVCAICRRNFSTSTDLMVHETCHNKSVCYGCKESFDTFEQLAKHRQCCKAIASQEVKKPKTLDDVLRPQTQEPSNLLKCSLCDETFTDMYYVTIHQEVHHAPSIKADLQEDDPMEIDALESIFTDNGNS